MVGYEENLESSNLILRPFPWFRWFNFYVKSTYNA